MSFQKSHTRLGTVSSHSPFSESEVATTNECLQRLSCLYNSTQHYDHHIGLWGTWHVLLSDETSQKTQSLCIICFCVWKYFRKIMLDAKLSSWLLSHDTEGWNVCGWWCMSQRNTNTQIVSSRLSPWWLQYTHHYDYHCPERPPAQTPSPAVDPVPEYPLHHLYKCNIS